MAGEVKELATRVCPCCNERSYRPKPLFDNVIECGSRCGMIYADTDKTQADYDAYYSQKGRYTDEWGGWNARRYVDQAERIENLGVPKSAIILDVGCGTGGLVWALYTSGFYNAYGIDPAAEESEDPDSRIDRGSWQDVTKGHDLLILSHVLEHVLDVKGLLHHLSKRTKHLYIEVPDARRYHVSETSPYQQFNEEHINHWDMCLLLQTLERSGFTVRACGESTCDPNSFPVIWVYAEAKQPPLADAIRLYCDKSAAMMASVEKQIAAIDSEVICWGIGALARRLEPLLVGKIYYSVDTRGCDPFCGKPVFRPNDDCNGDIPILVTTILHKDSVLKQIAKMGLKNPVITLGG